MRLVTFTDGSEFHAGVMVDDTRLVHLHEADPAIPDSVRAILEAGESMLTRVRAASAGGSAVVNLGGSVRLSAPIRDASKMLAIGLNYRLHAEELGLALPAKPIVFAKWPNTVAGPGDPIIAPKASEQLDWECELGVVIGKRARHVPAAQAFEYVAGYLNANDVSVRDWQFHSNTWTMGKNFDTHLPMGPYLVTADEVPDPAALTIQTYVNGVLKQDSSTGDLIFDIPQLIKYISTATTLEPGDVIVTGTPPGVASSRKPPEWLKAGDTVRVQITGLGVLENPVAAE